MSTAPATSRRQSRARSTPPQIAASAPRVLALNGATLDSSAVWRVCQPFEALRRRGYTADWDSKDNGTVAYIVGRYDIIVMPRLIWPLEYLDQARRWIDAFHRAGKMVIGEYDDDQWVSLEDHLRGNGEVDTSLGREARIATLRLMDGVTVSTPRLKTLLASHIHDDGQPLYAGPVAVVPNLIDLAWWRQVQAGTHRQARGLTIGWAGAKRQDADLSAMAEAWGRIARRYPRVRFVVQGHQPDVITDAVPPARLLRMPWMRLEEYPRGLVNVDIGCCAVEDNPFNRCKSNIKALEYGASGAAVVATPTLYKSVIRAGDTGYLARTADEWEAALAALIETPALRRLLARRLRQAVERHWSLDMHCERWMDAWSWLLTQWRERRAA